MPTDLKKARVVCENYLTRPVKELAGFIYVTLRPGESTRPCFSIDPSILAFLDEITKWKVEQGSVEVQIGSSSEDIRCFFEKVDIGPVLSYNRM